MRVRRLISALILIAFLPAAIGCSSTTTILVENDPAESEAATKFRTGEAIKISGYTRFDDGRRKWTGFVQTAPPDSLQFTPGPEERTSPWPFQLAKTDVLSVHFAEPSSAKTQFLALGMIALAGLIIWGVLFATSDDWNFSNSNR